LPYGVRIAPDAGKIGSHGRGFAGSGGIVLPQKRSVRPPDLARAAVARVAGSRKDLCRRFAGIQIGLCLHRRSGGPDGKAYGPANNFTATVHDDLERPPYTLLPVGHSTEPVIGRRFT
jgi:hypothetical protein